VSVWIEPFPTEWGAFSGVIRSRFDRCRAPVGLFAGPNGGEPCFATATAGVCSHCSKITVP
jgi:hypothetical protein